MFSLHQWIQAQIHLFTYNNNTWTLHSTNRRSYTIKIYSSDYEKKVFALSIKFNRLGPLDYCETQNIEYRNLREVTKDLTENIILQNKNFQINTEEIKKSNNKLKSDINMIHEKKN